MEDYERLGAFYLGRLWDGSAARVSPTPLLYDSKDLTTHAVCVGMTGSGKTGLAIGLIEEAIIDGIPVIAIDPKGDLGNLLLTFPDLRPEDFRPWIDEQEAARAGETPDAYAKAVAERWRKGLADWDQKPERIARFASAAERCLYTPGSRAGRPLAILRSLTAPSERLRADDDAFRERVSATATCLLGLLDIEADARRSREHILISTLLDRAWRAGEGMDLPALIRGITKPPFERVGVVDLESFFPEKERFALAMSLNQLVAAPGFEVWLEGDPLDVGRLLYTEDGRPRLSIVSVAHLEDRERMFVVSSLLNEVVAWTRSRPGSSSLAALLYMDEVTGYLPPVANPPSKGPMLTLLKQARAFGLGVVLATQNPVDLDYKAIANAGTWFLGRLQTERDKERVLDGLLSAANQSLDRAEIARLLSGLPSRVFLMQNVHEDGPVVFQTRWTLSYLAGPLGREQIRRLVPAASAAEATPAPAKASAPQAAAAAARAAEPGAAGASAKAAAPSDVMGERPPVPPGIHECFLRAAGGVSAGERIVYRPALVARATLHYVKSTLDLDAWQRRTMLAQIPQRTTDSPWGDAVALAEKADLDVTPVAGAAFAALPAAAVDARAHGRWRDMLVQHLQRNGALELFRSPAAPLVSQPGESAGEFRARTAAQLREQRDAAKEALRAKYNPKIARLRDRLQRAEQGVQREQAQFSDRTTQTAISLGASLVGSLFGRRLGSGATTVLRDASRSVRERGDVGRAQERADAVRQDLAALEAELASEVAALDAPAGATELPIESVKVPPRKTDTTVELLSLAWCPWREATGENPAPAYAMAAPGPSASTAT